MPRNYGDKEKINSLRTKSNKYRKVIFSLIIVIIVAFIIFFAIGMSLTYMWKYNGTFESVYLFVGSYAGGFLTVVGVIATILYTSNESKKTMEVEQRKFSNVEAMKLTRKECEDVKTITLYFIEIYTNVLNLVDNRTTANDINAMRNIVNSRRKFTITFSFINEKTSKNSNQYNALITLNKANLHLAEILQILLDKYLPYESKGEKISIIVNEINSCIAQVGVHLQLAENQVMVDSTENIYFDELL